MMKRYQLFSIVTLGFIALTAHDVAAMHGGEADAEVVTGVVTNGTEGTSPVIEDSQDNASKKTTKKSGHWIARGYTKSKKQRDAAAKRRRQAQVCVAHYDVSSDEDQDETHVANETRGINTKEEDSSDSSNVGEKKLTKFEQRLLAKKLRRQRRERHLTVDADITEKDLAAAKLLKDAVENKPGFGNRLKNFLLKNPLVRATRHAAEAIGSVQAGNAFLFCKDMVFCLNGSAVEIALSSATGGLIIVSLADLGWTLYDLWNYTLTLKDGNTEYKKLREQTI